MTQSSATPDIQVEFSQVAAFVRQVTHDVRNDLNGLDLQTAFVLELVTDPEATEEVRRIRHLIQQAAKRLQALSANFHVSQPNLVTYSAQMFVEDLQDRLAKTFPDTMANVEWSVKLGEEMISVDLEMIFNAVAEVFRNAFQFQEANQKISARAAVEAGRFVIDVTEEKTKAPTDPSTWGVLPFHSTKRGGYGLGLFRARRMLALHDGEIAASYDSSRAQVTTRVSLPLAS